MSSLSPLGALANVLSTGVGIGAANALVPPAQELANEAWRQFPDAPLVAVLLAQGVAQGQIERAWATDEALNTGVNGERFAKLVNVFDTGPGVGYAFQLWRRGKLGEAAFRRALEREALEEEWIEALVAIKQVLLTPAELAVMIQRTVVPNPGILPNQPSTQGSNVPPMPQVDIDPLEEAAGAGIDRERLAAMARIVGLPASPDLAARMVYRGIITRGAFNQAILEGNTRGEWAPYLFEGFRQIPTAHNGIEARLRGWIDDDAMYAETARHGMSKADTDLLFKVQGRPLSWHQVWIGLQRGGVYNGSTDAIDPAFLKALRESNIRPEWYNLAWAQRYTYPSAFVMRALTQDGTLTAAQAESDLIDMGWRPDRAKQAAEKWSGGASGSGGGFTGKAQTHLWNQAHTSFVASEIGQADVEGAFDQLAVPAEERAEIIGLWMTQRDMVRKQLTATQLKKAYENAVTNPATGQPWERFDVLARLTELGYSFEDAEVFLDT